MSYVIRLVGLAAGEPTSLDGQYLVEYDPDRRGVDPAGRPMLAHVVCTPNVAEAKRYTTPREALDEWRRPSMRWPDEGRFPPDGRPNRPLTAYTVDIHNPDAA
jgi:hypothetical protein